MSQTSRVLLIHPPVIRSCEPPPGPARLAGALTAAGIENRIWDANLECVLELISSPLRDDDVWTVRAARNRDQHLNDLRQGKAFRHVDTYRRIINDLNRLVSRAAPDPTAWRITLTDLDHASSSPLRSDDLDRSAKEPHQNPFFSFFSKELFALLDRYKPEIIGFSLNYLSQALTTFAMAGFLRATLTTMRLVVGGSLITSWHSLYGSLPVADEWFDAVVPGPGEEALVNFCRPSNRHTIEEKSLLETPPDFTSLKLERYLSPGPVLPIAAANGCFWSKCAFCPEKSEGNTFRPLPAKSGAEMVSNLVSRHHPTLIHFCDSAVSSVWLRELCNNPPGTFWYGFTRFMPPLDDLEFCRDLRQSGCVMLKLGLESGSQKVLDELSKGVDLMQASKILRNLAEAGIGAYVYVLFGTPAESVDEARSTVNFIAEHCREIGFLNVAIFNLPLGSPEAGRLETLPFGSPSGNRLETLPFNEGDLSLYSDFRHPRGWDRKSVRQFLDREFRPHPAIAPILRRDAPFFTSNHAPFFLITKQPQAVTF